MAGRHRLVALALIAVASEASGTVTYRFIAPQTSFAGAPGGMVTIPILLEETVTSPSTSLLVAENGVFSVGVRVMRTGTLPSDPARFVGAASVMPNTNQFFDPSNAVFAPVVSITAPEARLLEFARAAGLTGTATTPGVRVISVGNFNVTVGTVIGQTTTFQLADYAETSDTVTWTNFIALDDPPYTIAGTTVTVTVVNPGCYANCDGSTSFPILNVNDFQCFLTRFGVGDVYANCDGSTSAPTLNVNDFQCFLNRFASGCT